MRISRLLIASLLFAASSLSSVTAAPKPALRIAASAPASNVAIVRQVKDKTLGVTETVLGNGLTILTKETHAAPVAYFSVFYKVGSRNEITGQTGLSHILEHMMFKGTNDLPPGSISRIFQKNGAEINAATSMDYTYYHELISADRLELAVRIEADRMENSKFDPTELNHEMSVVRSELEGDANDPNWQLSNFTFTPLAFINHSYHWPTIGWRADVENAAKHREIIYNYYKNHYMPNNATVVVVGDFDTAKVVGLCQKYFGGYAPGKLESHHITPEAEQTGEHRGVLRRPGSTGQVMMGWKAPVLGNPDHYVMDVIGIILSSGRTARFYQNLVEPGYAQDTSAEGFDTRDPYLFIVSATPQAGVSNDRLEQALTTEIEKLKTAPVSDDELTRAKNQIEASFTFQNDSVSQQGDQLGFYQTVFGDYRYAATYVNRIKAITAAQIQAAAQKYFVADKRTVATFEPQPLPDGAAPLAEAQVTEHFGDVSTKPTPAQEKLVAELENKFNSGTKTTPKAHALPVRKVLSNGIVILVQENHANKTVAISGQIRAGSTFETEDKYGLSSLTAAMLSRGAAGKTEMQIATQLENVGANLSIGSEIEGAAFSGAALTKDFDLVISTLSDQLRRPDFPPAQFERLRALSLTTIKRARQDSGGAGGAGAVADLKFTEALYPKGHPYYTPSFDEQENSVKSITTADLKAFHDKYYRPDTMVIVVVGDVKAADAIDAIAKQFGDWEKPTDPAPIVDIPTVPLPDKAPATIYATIPGTSQTSLLYGHQSSIKRNDPNFYSTMVMDYILGGSIFGSRLGDKIRDKEGLAYSVYSNIDAGLGAGPFTVFVGTNPKNANKALSLIRSVVSDFREKGATQTEVKDAVDYLTGAYPLTLETNAGVAHVILAEEIYGLGLDYINRRADLYNKVTAKEVNALAKQLLQPSKATVVISGAAPEK
jgi:zinc protease